MTAVTTAQRGQPVHEHAQDIEPHEENALVRTLDEARSTFGMWLFVISEATLFAVLFFAYYYLASGGMRWMVEEPPALKFALPMLGVLLVSSFVLFLGEKAVKKMKYGWGRIAIAVTMLLGIGFVVLSYFEYQDHLQHLLPTSNAYGSIFYAITGLHLSHLILGLFFLAFVLVLRPLEPNTRPPHLPYKSAALYWHFVDTVWIFVVTLLYIVPHFRT